MLPATEKAESDLALGRRAAPATGIEGIHPQEQLDAASEEGRVWPSFQLRLQPLKPPIQ